MGADLVAAGLERGGAGTKVVLVVVGEQDVPSGAFTAADGLADASGADNNDDFLVHDECSWVRGRARCTRRLRDGAGVEEALRRCGRWTRVDGTTPWPSVGVPGSTPQGAGRSACSNDPAGVAAQLARRPSAWA